MLKGSCLCGGVCYEALGPVTLMARCHCVQCRKASGAEFATNASVPRDTFRVVTGESLLGVWESSPGAERVFCTRCGSPLFKREGGHPEQVRLRLGCLDDDGFAKRPELHVFVSSKPCWSEITDTLPQFERLPPSK